MSKINSIRYNGMTICEDDMILGPTLDLNPLSPEDAKALVTKLGECGIITNADRAIAMIFDMGVL